VSQGSLEGMYDFIDPCGMVGMDGDWMEFKMFWFAIDGLIVV